MNDLTNAAGILLQTRPTAVSLPNGIRYVMHRVNGGKGRAGSVEEVRRIAIGAAGEFIENAKTAVQRIGEIGAKRIVDGDTLLTHCNSGAAIEIMKTAWRQGRKLDVLVTETRPKFQGYITAHELVKVGIRLLSFWMMRSGTSFSAWTKSSSGQMRLQPTAP